MSTTPGTGLAAVLAASAKGWERTGLTAAAAAVVVLAWLAMLRGWRRRQARQAGLPPLPPAPSDPGEPLRPPLPGRYVGTTTAGNWLDRIAVHGLGARARGRLLLTPAGLTVERDGSTDLFLPGPAIRGARLDRALAGKVVGEGGLLVITWELTWEHGGQQLDTGFRADDPAEHRAWMQAIEHLIAEEETRP